MLAAAKRTAASFEADLCLQSSTGVVKRECIICEASLAAARGLPALQTEPRTGHETCSMPWTLIVVKASNCQGPRRPQPSQSMTVSSVKLRLPQWTGQLPPCSRKLCLQGSTDAKLDCSTLRESTCSRGTEALHSEHWCSREARLPQSAKLLISPRAGQHIPASRNSAFRAALKSRSLTALLCEAWLETADRAAASSAACSCARRTALEPRRWAASI